MQRRSPDPPPLRTHPILQKSAFLHLSAVLCRRTLHFWQNFSSVFLRAVLSSSLRPLCPFAAILFPLSSILFGCGFAALCLRASAVKTNRSFNCMVTARREGS